eukprot:c11687_g1_i5.p1 GENE.c11687_g1_i5~~c11687_g1_i5.p1  ORF type:complete len:1800 (+),score=389.77 c11687_g1_i5:1547-6946(+)
MLQVPQLDDLCEDIKLNEEERQELYRSVIHDIFVVSSSLANNSNKSGARKLKVRVQFECPEGVFRLVEQATSEVLLTLDFRNLRGAYRASANTAMADASLDFFDIRGKVCRICHNPPSSSVGSVPMLAIQFAFNPENTATVADRAQAHMMTALEMRSGPGALSRAETTQQPQASGPVRTAIRILHDSLRRAPTFSRFRHRLDPSSPSHSDEVQDDIDEPGPSDRTHRPVPLSEHSAATGLGASKPSELVFSSHYWQFTVTLVPVEVLVHIPFLTKLWEFFIRPWDPVQVDWDSFFVALLVLNYDMFFHLHGFRLIFLNHLMGPNTPLLEANLTDLQTNIKHVVASESRENITRESLLLVLLAAVDANYYNNQLKCWEPLLEKWRFAVTAESVGSGDEATQSLRVDGNSLRLSLSYALLKTLVDSQHTFASSTIIPHVTERISHSRKSKSYDGEAVSSKAATETSGTVPMPAAKRLQAFFVYNATGLPLQLQASSNEGWRILEPEDYVVLDLRCKVSTRNGTSMLDPLENLTVNLQVGAVVSEDRSPSSRLVTAPVSATVSATPTPSKPRTKARRVSSVSHPIDNVPIDRVGTYVYTLVPLSQVHDPLVKKKILVCEVTTQSDYSNLLTVRSAFLVHNALSLVSLEVKVMPVGSVIGPVKPQQNSPLPLHLSHATRIRIRPTKSYQWSDEIELEAVLHGKVVCRCLHTNRNHAMFVCRLRIERDANTTDSNTLDCPFTLHVESPMILKNLLPEALHFKITSDVKDILGDLKQTLAMNPSPMVRSTTTTHVETNGRLKRGETVFWYSLDPAHNSWKISIKTSSYPTWSSHEQIFPINKDSSPVKIIRLHNKFGNQATKIHLQVTEAVSGTVVVSVLAPYWLVNHTGIPLEVGTSMVAPSVASQHLSQPVDPSKSASPRSANFKAIHRTMSNPLPMPRKENILIAETMIGQEGTDADSDASDGVGVADSREASYLIPSRALVGKKMRLRATKASPWATINLESVQNATHIKLKLSEAHNRRSMFELVATVHAGQERYKLTKVIRLYPKFMLDNKSGVSVVVDPQLSLPGGAGSDVLRAVVDPACRIAYHPPGGTSHIRVAFQDSTPLAFSAPFSLDAVGTSIFLTTKSAIRAWVEVVVESSVIVFVFRQDNSSMEVQTVTEISRTPQLSLTAEIQGLFVSLVDHVPQELLNLSVNGIGVQILREGSCTDMKVVFEKIQLDNQLRTTVFPVLIAFEAPPKTPSFMLHFLRVHTDKLDHYRKFDVHLQVIDVALDGELLDALYELGDALSTQTSQITARNHDADVECQLSTRFVIGETPPASNMPMLFAYLNLPALRLYFTNLSSQNLSAVSANPFDIAKNAVINSALNIGRTAIHVKSKRLDHHFTSLDGLMNLLMNHYYEGIKSHLGTMIGHSLLIGDPFTVGASFVKAFKSLCVTPCSPEPESPKQHLAFRLGLGMLRFGQFLIFGPLEYLRTITFSLGQLIALTSMDKAFIVNRHRKMLLRRPNNVWQGVYYGALCLRDGTVHAVKGLVMEPSRGLRDADPTAARRLAGFAKGLGKGMYGLAAKPLASVFDGMSCAYDGMAASLAPHGPSRWPSRRLRTRPPRSVGFDRVLREYSRRESDGQNALSSIQQGLYSSDFYLDHVQLGHVVVMMSSCRILFLHPSRLYCKLQLPLHTISHIQALPLGLVFHLQQGTVSLPATLPRHGFRAHTQISKSRSVFLRIDQSFMQVVTSKKLQSLLALRDLLWVTHHPHPPTLTPTFSAPLKTPTLILSSSTDPASRARKRSESVDVSKYYNSVEGLL